VSISLHLFASGRASEGEGGASILDVRARNGRRQSVFRSYVFPYLDRPNLTVLAGSLVTRVTLQGNRVTGVDGLYNLAQTYRSRRADEPVEPTEASPGTQPPPQRAGRLLITGVALSIDNLAVGFAPGTYPVSRLLAAIIIGVVSVGLSLLGLELGRVLGNALGQRRELLGGIVLIIVGIAITAPLL